MRKVIFLVLWNKFDKTFLLTSKRTIHTIILLLVILLFSSKNYHGAMMGWGRTPQYCCLPHIEVGSIYEYFWHGVWGNSLIWNKSPIVRRWYSSSRRKLVRGDTSQTPSVRIFIHSFIHSFILSFTHSVNHLFVYWITPQGIGNHKKEKRKKHTKTHQTYRSKKNKKYIKIRRKH